MKLIFLNSETAIFGQKPVIFIKHALFQIFQLFSYQKLKLIDSEWFKTIQNESCSRILHVWIHLGWAYFQPLTLTILGLFSVHFYLIILFLFNFIYYIFLFCSTCPVRPWTFVRLTLLILFLDATQIKKWVTDDRTCEERLHGHAPKR